MSDSDIAVYCRLLQLKTLKNDQIAYAVQKLKQLMDALVEKNPGMEHRSSVYGRFAILKPYPEQALGFADELLRQATAAQVALGIGIAQGRIEPTYDLFGGNVAGSPINYAARLAFLRDTECWIAAEPEFVRAIRQSSSKSKKQFGKEESEPGKRIVLQFHFLEAKGGRLPKSPPGISCTNETAHVVAVDIVKYSQKPLREMMQAAAHLLQFNVRGPIEATGGVYHEFAPGGDGGIFVFRPGHANGGAKAAWRFLRDLREYCDNSVEVRFGVTTGPVVILDGGYPVGHGVLEADELSSLPPTGQVCSSKEFWSRKLDEFDRKGWTATSVKTRADAYLLSDSEDNSSPDPSDQQVDPAVRYENCRQRLREKIADILAGNATAFQLLGEFAPLEIVNSTAQKRGLAIADKLLTTPIDSVCPRLRELYVAARVAGPAAADAIREVYQAIVPQIVDRELIAMLRKHRDIDARKILLIPSSTSTALELIMAGVDGRPAEFATKPNDAGWRDGQWLVPAAPISGRDLSGAERLKSLNQVLAFMLQREVLGQLNDAHLWIDKELKHRGDLHIYMVVSDPHATPGITAATLSEDLVSDIRSRFQNLTLAELVPPHDAQAEAEREAVLPLLEMFQVIPKDSRHGPDGSP
ncbi:MAG: hypothetical protein NT069_04525 [Planctomycetota bacterium]|nr:hypothetical protein [Planctomycetota bacterium]